MAKPKRALREYRKGNAMSCAEAGAKIGVAESTWRSYENGHREIDADTALHMERVLGIPRERIRRDLFAPGNGRPRRNGHAVRA